MIKLNENIDVNSILNSIYYIHGDDILDGLNGNADDETIDLNIKLLNRYCKLLRVKNSNYNELIFVRIADELEDINNKKYDDIDISMQSGVYVDYISKSYTDSLGDFTYTHYICDINGTEYNFIVETNNMGTDDMFIINEKDFENFIFDFTKDSRIIHLVR